MTEIQRVTWDADGLAFTIDSEPRLELSIASSFSTVGQTRVQQTEEGVSVVQAISATCAVWGMASTVEGLMLEQARAQVGGGGGGPAWGQQQAATGRVSLAGQACSRGPAEQGAPACLSCPLGPWCPRR